MMPRLVPNYVQREILAGIPDVFDADAIWQAPGLALFSRRALLRDLLERAPREQRGRAATRCFSHITLALPQEEVDDDRHLTRGARVRELTEGLAALHQKDFGDLLQGDEVRYQVVGAERLVPGEVEVRFGHAVYLPAPGETIQYTVSVSRDSAVWKTACPVYPNQRLTLIGNDDQHATWAAPGWPFGLEGSILLVNDGPGTPIEVQVRPKDAFECVHDAAQGYYIVRSRRGGVDAAGAPLRLLLRVTPAPAAVAPAALVTPRPLAAQAAPPAASVPAAQPTRATAATAAASAAPAAEPVPARPAVWKPRMAAPADLTAVPAALQATPQPPIAAAAEAEATYAPVSRQRVALAALALPRLSRYRDTGAQALEIGLDRALAPSAGGSIIRFAVDDGDTLHAITAAGREAISVPASFRPVDHTALDLLAPAPAMADRYCALLRLPQPPALPVAPGVRQVFGRSTPVLAALRVLDSPRFLRHAAGSAASSATSSADRLGLSRSAFSFEPVTDGYRIARLSPTQALYHLDPDLNFVAAIGDATADAPYTLPAGHHLVAGHYVLRFDA
ncbi:hypothetical protein [Herbaspirillum sp. SJZ107]|uniref:hypothetical protein n=1 Tax=Herbaspirillum sp. SJZ107 TaxID=2572881 RepID=UPI00116C8C36|nr:hypothetical protein [Herbaspirillum sp. SJZ107]TQK11153.1 hypothetical protein FBX97_1090 [Herbaspirillum sp. SJZ107]